MHVDKTFVNQFEQLQLESNQLNANSGSSTLNLSEMRKWLMIFSKNYENLGREMENERTRARRQTEPPIKEAILGEWSLIDYENFEEYERHMGAFQHFAPNLKYEVRPDGKLKETGSGTRTFNLVEGNISNYVSSIGVDLFVEDNHVKTTWLHGSTTDRFIEDGRLWVVSHYFKNVSWARVYERVTKASPIKHRILGEWKMCGNFEKTSNTLRFVAEKDGSVEQDGKGEKWCKLRMERNCAVSEFENGRTLVWYIDEQDKLCVTNAYNGNVISERYYEKIFSKR